MKKKIFLTLLIAVIFLMPKTVKGLTDSEIQEKKEITIKSIPPKTENEFWQFSEVFNEQTGYNIEIDGCNSDYTSCTIIKYDPNGENPSTVVAENVKIVYQYDKDVKTVVDDILKKIPNTGINFTLNDVEAIYYIRDVAKFYRTSQDPENEPGPDLANYSRAYKEFIGYNNFKFEGRMGYEEQFEERVYGTGTFAYDGTIYAYTDGISITAPVVVYVDDNETNVAKALQTRLDKYFPGIIVEEDNSSTPLNSLNGELNYARETFNNCKGFKETIEANNENSEQAQNNWNNQCSSFSIDDDFSDVDAYIQDLEDDLKEHGYGLVDKMLPAIYTLRFSDESEVYFGVIKDSSKIFKDDIEVITSDAGSNVTISSSSVIPLDTLIQVAKLTDGENYNKIIKILENVINKDNAEIFDLKLFSKSTNDYINKLDNGTFEVKLPISEALQGKENLIVYYVSDDGKLEPHQVKLSDDKKYAIFTTNHFSIYTLGEQQEEKEPVYKLTFNFNGGTRQGEKEYALESVAIGFDVTKANFIDKLDVKAPEGKELDAIEINGTRVELGGNYLLNKDTVFKYLWKDLPKNEETVLPDVGEEVPKTFDNIESYIIMLVVSAIILVVTIIAITKKKIINNE